MTSYGPKKVLIQDIAVNALWACISGFLGSIIILLIVFSTSKFIDIAGTFQSANLAGGTTNPMFPFVLSIITFVATLITVLVWTKLLTMTDSEKYKSQGEIYGQIGFFAILLYLCFTPIYIYTGIQNYENILTVFIAHVLLFSFGSSLIIELLNNYRYVLIGLYWNFIALCAASSITLLLFYSMSTGQAKLIIMLIIIPLILTTMSLIKWLFEFLYYSYYKFTNLDGLGDIFYRIEQEERESMQEEEQKNSI